MINKLGHKEILFLIFSPFLAEIVLLKTVLLKTGKIPLKNISRHH